MDNPIAINDDRYPARVRLRQFVLFGEAPRHGLDRQPLMGERHLAAPAERAETAIRLGAGQVVYRDRHARLLRLQFTAFIAPPHVSISARPVMQSRRAASSANPVTTRSVAGFGTGSGGPFGPHSSGRRT